MSREVYSNLYEDEKDYDNNSSVEELDENSRSPRSVNSKETPPNSNYNDNVYQTPVSSVASYSSESVDTYSDLKQSQLKLPTLLNKPNNAYQTNPLSIANIIQTTEDQTNSSNKDYSFNLQNYLTPNNYEPYLQQLQQYQQPYQPQHQAQQQQQQQQQIKSKNVKPASTNIVPKVQAATAYLLQPPDAKSIAQAAQVATNNRNRRRTRTKFEAEHITILENAFQKTHYPDVNIVDKLADMLKMNTERISIWFQNRRARFKREKHHDPLPKIIEPPQDEEQSQTLQQLQQEDNLLAELEKTTSNGDDSLKSMSVKKANKLVRKPSVNDFNKEKEKRFNEDDNDQDTNGSLIANNEEQTPLKQEQTNLLDQFNMQYSIGYTPTHPMYPPHAPPTYPPHSHYNYNYNYNYGFNNFIHPLMYDQQRSTYLNQQQQYQSQFYQPAKGSNEPTNENSISTTSPSPNESRSNSPVSQSESSSPSKTESDTPSYPFPNYSYMNSESNNQSNSTNSIASNYYASAYPLFNLYASNNNAANNDYQTTSYQNAYYQN